MDISRSKAVTDDAGDRGHATMFFGLQGFTQQAAATVEVPYTVHAYTYDSPVHNAPGTDSPLRQRSLTHGRFQVPASLVVRSWS